MLLLEQGFNMFWTYFINNLILLFLFYWYSNKLFSQEKSKRYRILVIVTLVTLKSIFNLYNIFQVNLLITIFTYFSISSFHFEGTITKKVIFIGFFIIVSFISEICASIFLVPLMKQYAILSNTFIHTFIGNFLSRVILFVIIYIITKINDIKNIMDTKGVWYFITFPVISIIIIYSIMHSNLLEINPTLCTIISFGIITFNIIICIGFADIIKSKNIQIENEKFKNQKLHYLLLEEKIDNTKQFVHDFKKHINILNGYINFQEFDKLKSYLNELSIEIKNEESFIITGNQIVDLSINANKNTLMEHSIEIKYDIKVKNIHPVSELDFNIAFSNIFDNAIESCIRTKGHFIKIKLRKINNLIVLKVINPCSKTKINYETSKKNKEYHGYGIKNINKIAQKYNGTATFEFDKENHIFISTVIFEDSIKH